MVSFANGRWLPREPALLYEARPRPLTTTEGYGIRRQGEGDVSAREDRQRASS